MSNTITKRNVKPWSNVDQQDLDKTILDERLRLWREDGRKRAEKMTNYEGPPPNTDGAIKEVFKQFNNEEIKVFIKGMLFIKDMHTLPRYSCKECSDTGYVRHMGGIMPLDSKAAKAEYMQGRSGSPDGMVCFSAPEKCTKC